VTHNHLITGQPYGFKNKGESKVNAWGVKLTANQGCSGDSVRIVTRKGAVLKGILSRLIHVFHEDRDGMSIQMEAWSLRQPQEQAGE